MSGTATLLSKYGHADQSSGLWFVLWSSVCVWWYGLCNYTDWLFPLLVFLLFFKKLFIDKNVMLIFWVTWPHTGRIVTEWRYCKESKDWRGRTCLQPLLTFWNIAFLTHLLRQRFFRIYADRTGDPVFLNVNRFFGVFRIFPHRWDSFQRNFLWNFGRSCRQQATTSGIYSLVQKETRKKCMVVVVM